MCNALDHTCHSDCFLSGGICTDLCSMTGKLFTDQITNGAMFTNWDEGGNILLVVCQEQVSCWLVDRVKLEVSNGKAGKLYCIQQENGR